MNHWKRIVIVVAILIGGTMSFGYLSFNEFNSVLDDLSSNLSSAYNSAVSTRTPSKPTELSSEKDISVHLVESPALLEASTTISTATSTVDTIIRPIKAQEFLFTFPSGEDSIYVGCKYTVSWLASTTIASLGTTLVDAGTSKSSGPVASGLSRENIIDPNIQNLKWEVGKVRSGRYFISILNANGTTTDIRSQTFSVKEIPLKLGIEEKKNLCKATKGSL